jgi:hypothetical protein
VAAAVYVIEEVKQFDPRCGGPTRIIISSFSKDRRYLDSHLIDEYIVADLQNEVSKLQEGFKVEWNAKMRQVIEQVREVHAERIMIKPIKHE